MVTVEIVDTAGQEKYRSLSDRYYKKADGCLLVYDITNRESFDEAKNYFCQQINDKCKANIKVILLGNKTDLEDQRQVSAEDGVNFAIEKGYEFMETSCLKNRNVADSFETLIELTYGEAIKERANSNNNNTPEKNININSPKPKQSKGGCC